MAYKNLRDLLVNFQDDLGEYRINGEFTTAFYEALYEYYFDDMPYGVQKARTGDPYEWIGQRLEEDIGGLV